jgi:low affinity Fe/Cu permease
MLRTRRSFYYWRGTAGGGMAKKKHGISEWFETLSEAVTGWAGSTSAFASALGVIVFWAMLGPIFHFSDTWQLVINTGTTIVTFLMVFLIQRSQNKDALAIHLKLNELVAAIEGASNRLIDVESLSEKELTLLKRHYGELAALAKAEADVSQSHSVEEARHRHSLKKSPEAQRASRQPAS